MIRYSNNGHSTSSVDATNISVQQFVTKSTMNHPRFFLLLVATSFLRACADYGDDADTVMKSMLRRSDSDQLLHLVALIESNRDDSIATVRV